MSSDYTPPTGDEVRALLRALHLTGAAAGALCDVDGRAVRRWTGGQARMPFGALYTIAHRAAGRTITPGGWRNELAPLLDSAAH